VTETNATVFWMAVYDSGGSGSVESRRGKKKSVVKLRDRGAKQKIPLHILPYRGAKQNKTRGKKTHTIITRCPE
jgi:hypothetical protein